MAILTPFGQRREGRGGDKLFATQRRQQVCGTSPAFDLEVDRSLVKARSSLKAWSDPGAAVQMVTPPVLERVLTLGCLLRILWDAMRIVRAASSDDELDV